MSDDQEIAWRARIVLLRTAAGVLALVALTLLFRRMTS
jgi:hypothetical protein